MTGKYPIPADFPSYCTPWLALFEASLAKSWRPLLASPGGSHLTGKSSKDALPQIDHQRAALSKSVAPKSARSLKNNKLS